MAQQLVYGGGRYFDESMAADSQTYSYARLDNSITRKGTIPSSHINVALAECFPPSSVVPGAHPDQWGMYVKNLQMKPAYTTHRTGPNLFELVDASGPVLKFPRMEVTVEYTQFIYNQGETWNRTYSFTSEVLSLNLAGFNQDLAGSSSPIADYVIATKVVPIVTHELSRSQIPAATSGTPNLGLLRDLMGSVNAAAFEGAPPETILFSGAQIDQQFTWEGGPKWGWKLQFTERLLRIGNRIHGWNHVWDPLRGQFIRPVSPEGQPIYPLKNFNSVYLL